MKTIRIRMYGFRASEAVILRGFLARLTKQHDSIAFVINKTIAVPDLAIVDMGIVDDMEASQHRNCAQAWAELRVRHHDIPCILVYSKNQIEQKYTGISRVLSMHRPFGLSALAAQVRKLAVSCYFTPVVVEQVSKARILVVDDSPSLRTDMRVKLKNSNVIIDMAVNAEDALQKVAELGDVYKLVFMDVMMPGKMDGYDACRVIKQLHSDLPVVMLTSKSSVFSKVRGKIAKCNHYIVKPAAKDVLHEVLETYVFKGSFSNVGVGSSTSIVNH
ncbi:MAG: response regulator [Mariprofundales bacterium]